MEQNITGTSKRMDAFSDGIFAIVCTLLVLEIRVPELTDVQNSHELLHSLLKIMPSLIAFVFSFLNVAIFWLNHDGIGKTLKYYDLKLSLLNILFLLTISIIPFTTAFVTKYPTNVVSISSYGIILLLNAILSLLMFDHIAFKSKLMHERISLKAKKKIKLRIITAIVSYFLAILLGLINVYIPIAIYILMPILFLFLAKYLAI